MKAYKKNDRTRYFARVGSIILLAVTGISAMLGGSVLVIDPSGSLLGFEKDGLAGTVFTDFQLPGLILLSLIGVLNLVVAGLTINKAKPYPTLIFLQGAILFGWILVQVYLLPASHFLQAVFGLVGVMLMLLSSLLGSKRVL